MIYPRQGWNALRWAPILYRRGVPLRIVVRRTWGLFTTKANVSMRAERV